MPGLAQKQGTAPAGQEGLPARGPAAGRREVCTVRPTLHVSQALHDEKFKKEVI